MAKSNAKAANNGGQKYPCTYPDGHIEEVTYSHVKERNEAIIEDNIVYGLIHPEYSDAEIKKYEKEARAQQRSFLAFLREFPGAKIMYSWHTEMYEAISYGLSTRQETFEEIIHAGKAADQKIENKENQTACFPNAI